MLQLKVIAEHDYTIRARPVCGSIIHDVFRAIYGTNTIRLQYGYNPVRLSVPDNTV